MERTLSMVGQKIAIYNQDGKILLLKRTQGGSRDLPGGGILPNETALECVEREIQEEIGLQNIQGIHPVHTYAKTYADGTHAFFVGYTGILNIPSEIILSHEHNEYLWVDPQDIEKYNLPDYRVMTVKKSLE